MSYFLFLFNPRTARETCNSIKFVELASSRHQQGIALVAMPPYNQTSHRFLECPLCIQDILFRSATISCD
jgi:hypothetical protein